MPVWLRRTLGILALGGGAVGLAQVLMAVFQSPNVLTGVLFACFVALYSFGIWCGVLMLEAHDSALRRNTIYWLLQIPVLSSYVFGYVFVSGFHLTAWYSWAPTNFGLNFLLGSTASFNLFREPQVSYVGVNLFALAVAVLLNRLSVSEARSTSVPIAEPALASE